MRQLEFPENIQAIVGGKEYSLDNAVLKIWPESEETKGALCVEMEGVGLFTINQITETAIIHPVIDRLLTLPDKQI